MQFKKTKDLKEVVGKAIERAREGIKSQAIKTARRLESFSASVSESDYIVPEVEDKEVK